MRALCLILILLSFPAIADPTWHSGVITQIYPQSNGYVVLKFDNDSTACTNGNNPKYYYLIVGQNGVTQEGFDVMYSAALAAAVSGKLVTINFESSTSNCTINRLAVSFP